MMNQNRLATSYSVLKGEEHGKVHADFVVQMFSLGGVETQKTILNVLNLLNWLNTLLTRCAKIHIPMASSILHITSQVELTKKCSNIDSKNKSVKYNTYHQNDVTMCLYMLLWY